MTNTVTVKQLSKKQSPSIKNAIKGYSDTLLLLKTARAKLIDELERQNLAILDEENPEVYNVEYYTSFPCEIQGIATIVQIGSAFQCVSDTIRLDDTDSLPPDV